MIKPFELSESFSGLTEKGRGILEKITQRMEIVIAEYESNGYEFIDIEMEDRVRGQFRLIFRKLE